LDVYASPHQCEEFWYSNLPDEEAVRLNASCGGGTYREVQAYINNHFAGSFYPFPTLYTGGINPILWRPLTGIQSFNLPAYRLDITPFVGALNCGSSSSSSGSSGSGGGGSTPVNITLHVAGGGKSDVWYLNGILVLYPHHERGDNVVLGGEMMMVEDDGAKWDVSKSSTGEGGNQTNQTLRYVTKGGHHYTIAGTMQLPNGTEVMTVAQGSLDAWNDNIIDLAHDEHNTYGTLSSNYTVRRLMKSMTQHVEVGNSGAQISNFGNQTAWRESRGEMIESTVRCNYYPYSIKEYFGEDNSTMELRASIDMALEGSVQYSYYHNQDDDTTIAWNNRIVSEGIYNKSKHGSEVNAVMGHADETFTVTNAQQVG